MPLQAEVAGGHRARRSRSPMSGSPPPDGSFVRLRERLGRGMLLVVLIAPGTGVWDRRHWLTPG